MLFITHQFKTFYRHTWTIARSSFLRMHIYLHAIKIYYYSDIYPPHLDVDFSRCNNLHLSCSSCNIVDLLFRVIVLKKINLQTFVVEITIIHLLWSLTAPNGKSHLRLGGTCEWISAYSFVMNKHTSLFNEVVFFRKPLEWR